MKSRKITAAVLCAALICVLCGCSASAPTEPSAPVSSCSASAEDETLITLEGGSAEVKGEGASVSGSAVTVSAGGIYRISGGLEHGSIAVDTGAAPEEVILILDGADITNPSGAAIHIRQAKNARVVLADGSRNSLTSGSADRKNTDTENASGAALYAEDDLDIDGGGTLHVYGYINNGIGCKNDLDINGGTITVDAVNNGIRGADSVEIKGGTISVTAGNDGVKSATADKAGKGYITVSGGTLSVYALGDGISAETELNITGGTLSITADGDAVQNSSKAAKANTALNIGGGDITLISRASSAAACDRDITVSGGNVLLAAGKRPFNAKGNFALTGGQVFALGNSVLSGGSEKSFEPQEATQGYVFAQLSGGEGDKLSLTDGERELAAAKAPAPYTRVLISTAEIVPGSEYTVSSGAASVSAIAG